MCIESIIAKSGSTLTLLVALVLLLLLVPSNSDSDLESKWKYLPTDNCGYGLPSDRIIGGEEATLGQFPWMARLAYQMDPMIKTLTYMCGGSIINRWYVVTANHCFEGALGETIKKVRVGENFLKDLIDCEKDVCAPPVQDLDVEYFSRYTGPKLEDEVNYGDIGLIKVVTPIRFNDFVQPICLPRADIWRQLDLPPGTMMTVAGWGNTNPEGHVIPDRLMSVQVPMSERETCQSVYRSNIIDDSHICAGAGKGKDSCVGDSGGPLMKVVAVDGPPRYYLFGLVSYGLKLCGYTTAVYTNITHHINWILDNIEPIL